ncbi:MAG: hypothetical protein WBL85_02610 [Sedimentisphaerales bacterium]
MEPQAFLDLAANLKDGKNEASWRTSVSRSYYALLNITAQFVKPHFPRNFSGEAKDHDTVHKYLHNCGIEAVEDVASDLRDLRIERNAADYDLELDRFEGNHASLMYLKAKFAMQAFGRATRNADGRKAIIDGINSYKQRTNS